MFFGTFLTITDENVSTTIGHAKNLIEDLTPMLILIIAVGIGLIIIQVIVNTIQRK